MNLTQLDNLCAAAGSHHAILITRDLEKAVFSVQPPRASGVPGAEYVVELSCIEGSAIAKEVPPGKLPDFCPERHINFDRTFCLYWEEAEFLDLLTDEGAALWWGKLCEFLLRQQVAETQGRWPGKSDARAHGPKAAGLQAKAEKIASDFGSDFPEALREDRIAVQRVRYGGEYRLRLLKDGRRVVTVIEEERRVMTKRQRCKCEAARSSGLPLCACGNHANDLAQLVLAIHGWKAAEQDFFQELAEQKRQCCGTIDDCPLATLGEAALLKAA